jgi:hypothetical protein
MAWAWNDPIVEGTDWQSAEFQTIFQRACRERYVAKQLAGYAADGASVDWPCLPGDDIQKAERIMLLQSTVGSTWGANVPAASTAILHVGDTGYDGDSNIVRRPTEILAGVGLPNGYTRKRPRTTLVPGIHDFDDNILANGMLALNAYGQVVVRHDGVWYQPPETGSPDVAGLWSLQTGAYVLDPALPPATLSRLGVETEVPGVWLVNRRVWRPDTLSNYQAAPNRLKDIVNGIGYCQPGDYIGIWIWQELMAVFNDLKVTVHEIVGWNTGAHSYACGYVPFDGFRQWPGDSPTAVYQILTPASAGAQWYLYRADAEAAADADYEGPIDPPNDIGYGDWQVPGEDPIGGIATSWSTSYTYGEPSGWVAQKGCSRLSFMATIQGRTPCTLSLVVHTYPNWDLYNQVHGVYDDCGEGFTRNAVTLRAGPIAMNHTDAVTRKVVFTGGLTGQVPSAYGDPPGRGFFVSAAVLAHWDFVYKAPA